MTHTPQEQQKKETAQEVQRIKIETPKSSPEVLSTPHDILGKEYEFNGVSFTVLGMEPVFFDGDEAAEDLRPGTVANVNIQKQRIPVISFQGGMAHITKIQIGDEVIVGSAEILKYITVVEYALDGWKTNAHLAVELGVRWSTIARCSNFYRESHPEWFRDYKSPTGQVLEHYAPELCTIIRDEITKNGSTPIGWMTCFGLANELLISSNTLKYRTKSFHQSNPEWFRDYKSPTGQVLEHYAPELCTIIRDEILKIEQAPKGWMTNNALMIELSISAESTIKNRSNTYRQSHPEWFCEYRTSKGHMHEHYSPQLCDLIRDEITKIKQAPEGWMTNNGLRIELGIAERTVASIAHFYRQSHPDWFHTYKTQNNLICGHYSSELCDLIRKAVKDKRL